MIPVKIDFDVVLESVRFSCLKTLLFRAVPRVGDLVRPIHEMDAIAVQAVYFEPDSTIVLHLVEANHENVQELSGEIRAAFQIRGFEVS